MVALSGLSGHSMASIKRPVNWQEKITSESQPERVLRHLDTQYAQWSQSAEQEPTR